MPRANIEYNGKWACFSSISDAFITKFMDKVKYENWRKKEYGQANYSPVEECNTMTIKKAVSSIRLNRNHDEAMRCLLECGISELECGQLMYDIEREEYCPIPKENGLYECPNCSKEIELNQTECDNDTCCLKFVWIT